MFIFNLSRFFKIVISIITEKAKSYLNRALLALFLSVQMGAMKNRKNLSFEILGASIRHENHVKGKCFNICCVYIFSLGHVRDLRKL